MRNMTRLQMRTLVAASLICAAPATLARPECPCDPDSWRAELEENYGDMLGCSYSSVSGTKQAIGTFDNPGQANNLDRNFLISAKSLKRCGLFSAQFTNLRGGEVKACIDDWLVYCATEF